MNSRRCHSSSFGFYLPHTPDPQVFGLFYFSLLFLSLPMAIQHITLGQFHNGDLSNVESTGLSMLIRSSTTIHIFSFFHLCKAAPIEYDHLWDNIIRSNLMQDTKHVKLWNWNNSLTGHWLKRPLKTLQIAAENLRSSQERWFARSRKINASQVAVGRKTLSSKLSPKETLLITGPNGGRRNSRTKTLFRNFTMLQWCRGILGAWRAALTSTSRIPLIWKKSKNTAVKLDLIVKYQHTQRKDMTLCNQTSQTL